MIFSIRWFTEYLLKAEEIRKDVVDNEVVELVDPKFPIEENARIIGEMGAVQAFSKLENCVNSNPSFASKIEKMGGLSSDNYQVIDEVFSSSKTKKYSKDFKENVYVARGEYALDIGLYSQAYYDLNKTLEINPKNDRAYLNRALVNMENGNVEKAIKDFQSHAKYRPINVMEVLRFSEGFMVGIPEGMNSSIESGIDFIIHASCHPITTGKELVDAFGHLAKLTKNQNWAELSKALAPEIVETIEVWESIPYRQRGRRAGYVIGKYGTDFLIGGASLKVGKIAVAETKVLIAARV